MLLYYLKTVSLYNLQFLQNTINMKKSINNQKLEKSQLEESYERMNEALKDTSFFVSNAIDKIGKSIVIVITGNIVDKNFDKFGIRNILNAKFKLVENKTRVKKNLVNMQFSILKKDLETKGHRIISVSVKDNKPEEQQPQKPKDEGIPVFARNYNDGHNHEYNKEGYCYYCGINKAQLDINKDEICLKRQEEIISKHMGSDIIKYLGDTEKKLYSTLLELNILDDYLIGQITGMIKEISKGANTGFMVFPDQGYLNEKVRKVLERIEEKRDLARRLNQ